MPQDIPIACTLNAVDLPVRLAQMRTIGADALRSVERSGPRAELRFAPSVRERLDDVVAAESRCCVFLNIDVAVRDEDLVLTIVAPAGAEPIMSDLVAAFEGKASA